MTGEEKTPNKRDPKTGEFPSEVRPHGRFRRYRKMMPSAGKKGSFWTRVNKDGSRDIMMTRTSTGKTVVQSHLKPIKQKSKKGRGKKHGHGKKK
jgi:hypothetical protein